MSAVLEKTVRDLARLYGQPPEVFVRVMLQSGVITKEQAAELLQVMSA